MPMRLSSTLSALFFLALLTSCCKENRAVPSVMFGQPEPQEDMADYDLPDMQAAGELIAVTLSGPETYYEYRGQGFGLQYAMAESFASTIGTRLRMEMLSDTAELLSKLTAGDADLIAFEMDSAYCAAYSSDVQLVGGRWCVRSASSLLAQAVNRWWQPDTRTRFLAQEQARMAPANRVRRTARPPMLSRASGTISAYDALFIRAAHRLGWDWRLLAAQCYQESGFDPQAVSWAGACGLMQIMPSTGARLGLSPADLYDPARNIESASRYLAQLNQSFADITMPHERIYFVLAAYNGGAGHIRDAMALAEADGHTPRRWIDVEPYVLRLSSPDYYRRPQVKFGYLHGKETVSYVQQIRHRWAAYRGSARSYPTGHQPQPSASKPSRIRPRTDYINDSTLIP